MTPKEFKDDLSVILMDLCGRQTCDGDCKLCHNQLYYFNAEDYVKKLINNLIGDNTSNDYCECSEYGICTYCARNALREELRKIVRGGKE